MHREKISDHVDYPIAGLDLSKHLRGPIDPEDPPIYDLYAVCNHMGNLGGGHYTAYVRNPKNGSWYCMDDAHTSPVNAAKVVSDKGYVLFYRKRSAGDQLGLSPSTAGIAADSEGGVELAGLSTKLESLSVTGAAGGSAPEA